MTSHERHCSGLLTDKLVETRAGRPYADVDLTNGRIALPPVIVKNRGQVCEENTIHMAMTVMERQFGRVDSEVLVAEVGPRINLTENESAV